MQTDRRAARETEILEAAFAVLCARGFAGATMQEVARTASASKETLYNWFGDKRGLFGALVAANAETAKAVLRGALRSEAATGPALEVFGVALLTLLTGDRAVAMNRAAAADADNGAILGQTLAESGREAVLPLLVDLIAAARARGEVAIDDDRSAIEAYLGLLLGDLPIRRVIGVADAPSADEIEARAARAASQWLRLYAVTRP